MGEPTDCVPRSGRGVTTLLNYAVLLVVVAIVVSGLFLGIGTFVENQQERAIGSQMETVGNRLAGDLTAADRLVRTANTTVDRATTVRIRSRLPATVAGSQYFIRIDGLSGDRYLIRLRSVDPEVETSVVVRSTVGIRVPDGWVTGGRLTITYEDSTQDDLPEPGDTADLEVRSADG